eukprot:4340563-Amphidinium_carterae.2
MGTKMQVSFTVDGPGLARLSWLLSLPESMCSSPASTSTPAKMSQEEDANSSARQPVSLRRFWNNTRVVDVKTNRFINKLGRHVTKGNKARGNQQEVHFGYAATLESLFNKELTSDPVLNLLWNA